MSDARHAAIATPDSDMKYDIKSVRKFDVQLPFHRYMSWTLCTLSKI